MQILLEWAKVIAPILIALIGIVPTIKKKANETNEEIKKLSESVHSISGKLDKHIRENEDTTAEEWRVRVLSFDDNLCNPNTPYPSEANFMQARSDCDKYRKYIDQHKDFVNGIGESAMEHIDKVWETCKHNNLFGHFK